MVPSGETAVANFIGFEISGKIFELSVSVG